MLKQWFRVLRGWLVGGVTFSLVFSGIGFCCLLSEENDVTVGLTFIVFAIILNVIMLTVGCCSYLVVKSKDIEKEAEEI